jgi:hypothetical protein
MTTPGMQGEVSPESMKKALSFCRREPARRETGPFRCRCEDRGPKPAETLAASGRPAYTGVGSGESKRKSRFTWRFSVNGHFG